MGIVGAHGCAPTLQTRYELPTTIQRSILATESCGSGEKWRTYSILLRYGAYSNRTILVALQLHSTPGQNNHEDDAVDHHRKFR